ncbi:MAG TPA: peptidoglycan editing factor PgeF [Firmicutes bacterium]|nr:peptidoglycan editing factor PgeF [Bacillota bacterium]
MDGDLRIYRSELLLKLPWLAQGFSTRTGGCSTGPYTTLNLGPATGDLPSRVVANRERFFSFFGLTPEKVRGVKQVHGREIFVVREKGPARTGAGLPAADGLVTALPGVAVATVHADCVPVIIVDPVHRVVAAVHAGWRGTLAGIVFSALKVMGVEYKTDPGECWAAIGPAIGKCCYRVPQERINLFYNQWPDLSGLTPPVDRLDLAGISRDLLRKAGLAGDNIDLAGICTSCRQEEFFSYRRDRGETGRMLSLAVLKERQE